MLYRPPEGKAARARQDEDAANGGLRREPELPEHVAVAPETIVPSPAREFDIIDDADDSAALQARALSQQMRSVVRQTVLDRDDGPGM